MSAFAPPQFRAARGWNGGHRQTLAAALLFRPARLATACLEIVTLNDGDQIVLHDSRPANWRAGGTAALLVHGLCGSFLSPYMTRITSKLVARGVRVFRMDLRGCGAGVHLARWPYHSGRSADLAAALQHVARLCPDSPLSALGFSLGANILLKLLGESPAEVPTALVRALAVCPPIDLHLCVRQLQTGLRKMYDQFFVRLLLRQIQQRIQLVANLPLPENWPGSPGAGNGSRAAGGWQAPRTLEELDDRFTAPLSGFRSALHYYQSCSSGQFLPAIRIPTLVIAAADDPIVPAPHLQIADWSAATQLLLATGGGHMGFLSRRDAHDADRFWLDWRAVEWCLSGGEQTGKFSRPQ